MSRLPFDDENPNLKAPQVPTVPRGSRGSKGPSVGMRLQRLPTVATLEPAPTRTVLTVSELNATIRDLLENQLQNVWVEGEISNARVWNTGHMYFTLKDGASQIKAVMFRSAVRYLKFKPEDGLKVVARGKISVYDPKGEYQIICEHMEPKGLGSLQQAFEQLKKKLAAEGLFDQARKRPLPALPRRIGLVTSIDGAALRDIIRVLRRRYPNAHLVISPTRVQGEGAGREVAHAIRKVARIEAVDVIIVGARRRIARRSVGVQRRSAGARDRRVAGAGHLRRRPRNRFHDLRISSPTCARRRRRRRRSSWSGARTSSSRTSTASASGSTRRFIIGCGAWRRGCTCSKARPGFAGFEGRLAVRGRHVSELAAALRQRISQGAARRVAPPRAAAPLARSVRSAASPRRGPHAAGVARRRSCRPRCGAGSRARRARIGALAARIDGLSPLAVLGPRLCGDLGRLANAYHS